MDPETKPENSPDVSEQSEALEATELSRLEDPESSALVASSEAEQGVSQWQQAQHQAALFLDQLIDNIGHFFGDFFVSFQRPLLLLVLLLGAGVLLKLALAMLDAIDDIPLLATLFEAIGFIYTVWFVYRYLWFAESRKELIDNTQSFLDQMLGRDSATS